MKFSSTTLILLLLNLQEAQALDWWIFVGLLFPRDHPFWDRYRDTCPPRIENAVTDTLVVNQVNDPGFGNLANRYSFAMASFGDYVYVGTLNSPNFEEYRDEFFFGKPIESEGAEIWRGRKEDNYAWEKVFDLTDKPNNYGARKMVVVGDYLYMVTANHEGTEGNGAEVYKTSDGRTWTLENTPGFSDPANLSGRSLAACGGYLYVGVENRQTASKIFRRALEANGDLSSSATWQLVEGNGFGKHFNYFVSEFLEFKGSFYAGTLNGLNGMELWKTANCDAANPDDVHFTNVFVGLTSPGHGHFDWGVITLFKVSTMSLGEVMFLGTVNYVKGASLFYSTDGKRFETIFQYGLHSIGGSADIGYIWSVALYNNRLYAGTYVEGDRFSGWLYDHGRTGQFVLLSLDPERPTADVKIETEDAFGFQCFQDGIRNMVVHDDKLIMGTAGNKNGFATLVFEASPL